MKSKWTFIGGLVVALLLALTVGLTQAQADPGSPPGSEFLLSRGVHEIQRDSFLAYNSVRDEYFVAWTDEGPGATYATYGQRLAADGTFTGSQAISLTTGVYVSAIAHNPVSDTYLLVGYGGWPSRVGAQVISGTGVPIGAPLTSPMTDTYRPAVAHNTADNLWLAVWFSGTVNSDLYGQLVRADGTPEGGMIGVTVGTPGSQRDAAVAYNSIDNEFLVVWQDNRNGNNDIWGRRIGGDGTVLGSEIQIATQTSHQWLPSVAYNHATNEFLVVWADYNGFDVRARRVAGDGSLPASDFLVSSHLGTGLNTDVTCNPATGEYWVVWQDDRGGSNADDIYARRVKGDGTLAGSEFVVVAAPGWQLAPRVVCSAGGDCLATWGDPRTGGNDYDIYARRLNATGAPAGSEFIVSVAPRYAGSPSVAVNTSDGSALAVWSGNPAGGSANVYGQLIRSSSTLSGANLILSSSDMPKTSPAAAYNPADHNYLTVWAENRSGEYYIYGHVISPSGALSGTDDLLIANAANSGGEPALAYNITNNEYLVAFVDANIDELFLIYFYGIRAARLSRSGVLLSDVWFGDYTEASQGHPDVAHGSAQNLYVTVWQSGTLAYGQAVNAGGALSGTAFVLSPTTAYQDYPAIAYNSAANEFLATWIQYTGPSTSTIYARRLSGAGAPLTTPFTVTGILTYTTALELAYDSDRNEYLLAWSDKRIPSADYDLHARRLASDGTPIGDVIPLSEARNNQMAVALSYNPVRREYLAAWQDDRLRGTDWSYTSDDIYGLRLPTQTDLTLSSKSVSSGTARPGDVLTYTVLIANDGLVDAKAALSDAIPIDTAYIPGSAWASAGMVNDANGIRWSGVVTSGESVTVTFAVRLPVPLANNLQIVNRALISDTLNPAPLTRAITTTVQAPIFTLVKTDAPDPVPPGATLTYTVRLTNTGYAEASGLVMTETYDANFAFAGASPPPDVGNNVWNVGALDIGAGRTIVITGQVGSGVANGTVLTNLVTLDSDQTTPQQASATTVASSGPLLALVKSAPSAVEPGQTLTYTLRTTNNGLGNATGLVVTDTLPQHITGGAASPPPSSGVIAAGQTVTWTRGTLGVGASDGITLVVTVATGLSNGTMLTNTARASCNEGATAVGQATTTIYRPAALSVTKRDTPDPVAPGGTVTYNILVTNTGGEAAWGVEIQEAYDSRFTFQSATPAPSIGNGYWYTPLLAAGQLYAITVTGRVSDAVAPGQVLTNSVTASWDFAYSSEAVITTTVAHRLYLPLVLKYQ